MISKQTEEKSYNVQIWVGLRVGYSDEVHPIKDVEELVDEYVNEIKDCVTITPTQFRYVNGNEPGVIVGYINYPRFPQPPEELTKRALELGEILMCGLGQNRVSVTTPDKTYMLERNECIQEGDELVALMTIRNVLGSPLFEKGETYKVLNVVDNFITINHILYANEHADFDLEWVMKNFKIK